jgi:hypothetical protein
MTNLVSPLAAPFLMAAQFTAADYEFTARFTAHRGR